MTLDKLEWELALLLNGRADCAFTGEWGMVRDYDRRIADKQDEIGLYKRQLENVVNQLFSRKVRQEGR